MPWFKEDSILRNKRKWENRGLWKLRVRASGKKNHYQQQKQTNKNCEREYYKTGNDLIIEISVVVT